jgi:hypothetical protein
MSWLYSRALVEDYLVQQPVELDQCAPLSWIGTADAFLSSDKTNESFQPSRYGMMFAPLILENGEELRSCQAGFRAKPLVRPHEDDEQP